MTGKQKVTLSFGDKSTMIVDNTVVIENVNDIRLTKYGYVVIETDTDICTYATDSLLGTVAKLMEDDNT